MLKVVMNVTTIIFLIHKKSYVNALKAYLYLIIIKIYVKNVNLVNIMMSHQIFAKVSLCLYIIFLI